jgi:PAP2 superfamily protein
MSTQPLSVVVPAGKRARGSASPGPTLPRLAAVPRDVLALTLGCVGFVAVGAWISRLAGAPFVVPAGHSPALDTHFALPLLAAILGYAVLQFGARALPMNGVGATAWGRRALIDVYLLGLFLVVVYVHFHIKMWVPLLNPRTYDAPFFAIDKRFHVLIEALRSLRHGIAVVLPRADVWYQLGFFSMFSLSFWFHAAGPRRWHYHNIVALSATELIGGLSYLVAPAVGPFIFEHGDNAMATAAQLRMYEQFQALRAHGASWLQVHGSGYFTAPLAAMPSLHLAAAVVIAYYAVRAQLVVAPFAIAVVGWISIESVVARWHYLVDLPAGLVVAAVAIALANWLCRGRLEGPVPEVACDLARAERLPA